MKRQQPWATKLVNGQPIKVGQRELIPVVRMRSIMRREVTFGTKASRGRGGGLVWLQPVAVIVRQPDGSDEQYVTIPDETGTAIEGMLMAALALPALYLLVASLMFLWRHVLSTKDQHVPE